LEEFGVNCGNARKPTAKQIVAITGSLFNNFLKNHITLHTHHNCIFSQTDYLRLAVFSSVHEDYAEGSSIQLNYNYELKWAIPEFPQFARRCPTGDSLLRHLKKFNGTELYSMHDVITEKIIKTAIRAGGINRKVDLAIDCTDIPYFGFKDDPQVVSKKPERGTDHSYRYATSNIVVAGQRFTLKAIAIEENGSLHTVIEKLITHAKTLVNIDHVFLDKGFNSIKDVSTLNKMGCKYIMPARNDPKVKRAIRIHEVNTIHRYRIGTESNNAYTNLAITYDRKGEKIGFFTNTEKSSLVTTLYSKRWGIETSYNKTKNDFLAKTTSKNPIIRLFYFLLAVCLYNLWQLANMSMSPTQGRSFSKYAVSAPIFGKLLLTTIEMLDKEPPNILYTQSLGPPAILTG
jgi:hypothetical protein